MTQLQNIVLEWIRNNPWQRCSSCCHTLSAKHGKSYYQIEAAHVALRRKDLIQKRGSSMYTQYAVMEVK